MEIPAPDLLHETIGRFSQSIDASRVVLYEIILRDDNIRLAKQIEWQSESILPRYARPKAFTSFEEWGLQRWQRILLSGNPLVEDVSSCPQSERGYFSFRACHSCMLYPLMAGNELRAVLAIEDCLRTRTWDVTSMEHMRSIGTQILEQWSGIQASDDRAHLQRDLLELRLLRDEHAKELREMKEWKDRLFTSISHEFRTPLYTLLGFSATLLENEELDEDKEIRRTCLQHIHEQATRLGKLVDELLYASHLQSERVPAPLGLQDFGDIFDETIVIFRRRAEQEGLDLFVDRAEGDLQLYGEGGQLRQLVYSLLDHSVRNTPKGGWISAELSGDSATIVMKINASGSGIKLEAVEQYFDPFFTPTPSESATGTFGLGLSIAKDIVDLHNGFITVENKEDEGAGFVVILPKKPSE